ncbi:MAG: response regulator [Desulfocapsaceae bacterium]
MEKKLIAKVLLVDDEEDFVRVLAERLEVRGLEVFTANRGLEAVEMVGRQGFDIVVLDLAMPGMDGLETLKKIKDHDPDIEIVMLSGKGTMRSGVDAIKSGAEDFLEKPVDLAVLLEKIEEAKERRLLTLQRKASEKVSEILEKKGW